MDRFLPGLPGTSPPFFRTPSCPRPIPIDPAPHHFPPPHGLVSIRPPGNRSISCPREPPSLSPSLIFIHDTWVVFPVFVGGGVVVGRPLSITVFLAAAENELAAAAAAAGAREGGKGGVSALARSPAT